MYRIQNSNEFLKYLCSEDAIPVYFVSVFQTYNIVTISLRGIEPLKP